MAAPEGFNAHPGGSPDNPMSRYPAPRRLRRAAPVALALAGLAVASPAPASDERRARSAAEAERDAPAPTLRSLSAALVDHDLSFGPGSQASSAVAVDPGDPTRVIAATNDAGSMPVAYISEAGLAAGSVAARTPSTSVVSPGPSGAPRETALCCDPAVAADSDGNLWMAVAGASPGGRIVVARAAAGSTAFGATSAGLPRSSAGGEPAKPALAVRGGDRIAAAWVESVAGGKAVFVSLCALAAGAAACDDPGNWTSPATVAPREDPLSMPDLGFAPNGDLYAVWWDGGAGNAIRIDRCRAGEGCDRSASWNEDARIADLDAADDDGDGSLDPLPQRCPIIAAPGGLVNPSPSVEVDRGGVALVAYSDLRDNADPARPTRCTASGSDKTFDSFVAASPEANVLPDPGSGIRISGDGPLELNDHFLPALSADPSTGQVEASFYTTDGDPSGQRTDRVYVLSSDAGASYSPPAGISDAASRFSGPLSDGIDYGERQGADSAGGVFLPVWTDNRPLQSRDPDLYALSPEVETAITSAPSGVVGEATVAFGFSTPAPRTECALDGGVPGPCSAPLQVGPLHNGPHSLGVRATDGAGNPMDRTPAVAEWTVADSTPPETAITRKPRRRTRSRRPRFEFASNEPGARFQCRYDGGRWSGCRTPKRAKVAVGRHRFRVRALDLAGNVDPTPSKHRFRRKRACPRKRGGGRRC